MRLHLALLALLAVLPSLAMAQQCTPSLKWTTAKGQILVNGQPLVLKGVNYFGFETETFAPHGLWSYDLNYYLDLIKSNNFNAIRVPFSMEMVRRNPGNLNINCAANPGLCGKSALEVMDVFIDRAAERGLLIMLDNHRITAGGGISELWYNNEYSEAQVIDLWKALIARYKNRWNVFAIDLKNEPHDRASWGNGQPDTDWNKAAERMINALSSFPGLFFVEGIEWGGRMENVAQCPINTGIASLNNRVVYSPHCYGPSVYDRPEFNTPAFPGNLDAIYMGKYGFIVEKTGQPVVVGEWGGRAEPGTRDARWNEWYVEWLRGKCLTNNFYWCLNPNSGDTGGLLEDDWRTPIARKLALTARAQPSPTKFEARDGRVCITPGAFPESHCGGAGGGGGGSTPTRPATQAPTTSRPGGGEGAGGVTAQAVQVNQWEENGRATKQFTLRISNGSTGRVCNIQLRLNANIKEKWNIDDAGNGLVRTASWLQIAPGQSSEHAGFIAYGDAAPAVVATQSC